MGGGLKYNVFLLSCRHKYSGRVSRSRNFFNVKIEGLNHFLDRDLDIGRSFLPRLFYIFYFIFNKPIYSISYST